MRTPRYWTSQWTVPYCNAPPGAECNALPLPVDPMPLPAADELRCGATRCGGNTEQADVAPGVVDSAVKWDLAESAGKYRWTPNCNQPHLLPVPVPVLTNPFIASSAVLPDFFLPETVFQIPLFAC